MTKREGYRAVVARFRSRIALATKIRVVAHSSKLANEVYLLRAERDEARRELCFQVYINGGVTPSQYAKAMNWDCFEDNR